MLHVVAARRGRQEERVEKRKEQEEEEPKERMGTVDPDQGNHSMASEDEQLSDVQVLISGIPGLSHCSV